MQALPSGESEENPVRLSVISQFRNPVDDPCKNNECARDNRTVCPRIRRQSFFQSMQIFHDPIHLSPPVISKSVIYTRKEDFESTVQEHLQTKGKSRLTASGRKTAAADVKSMEPFLNTGIKITTANATQFKTLQKTGIPEICGAPQCTHFTRDAAITLWQTPHKTFSARVPQGDTSFFQARTPLCNIDSLQFP